MKRNGYTCQKCGLVDLTGKKLVAHHIYAYKKYESLRYDINNGGTVCCACHKDFHSKYGKGENTLEQWSQFLSGSHFRKTPCCIVCDKPLDTYTMKCEVYHAML